MEDPSSDSDADRVILEISGQKYDVTDYIAAHPGEGHNDIYLEDYAGKDVTKEFEYFHSKLDKPVPQTILEKVRERGNHKKIFLVSE
jgi:cytochrome b involved in lipid metabolism